MTSPVPSFDCINNAWLLSKDGSEELRFSNMYIMIYRNVSSVFRIEIEQLGVEEKDDVGISVIRMGTDPEIETVNAGSVTLSKTEILERVDKLLAILGVEVVRD